jgi:hypothetical protein
MPLESTKKPVAVDLVVVVEEATAAEAIETKAEAVEETLVVAVEAAEDQVEQAVVAEVAAVLAVLVHLDQGALAAAQEVEEDKLLEFANNSK